MLVKGTNIGTTTDVQGNFRIANVPATAKTLLVSYIGLKKAEVQIHSNMSVALEAEDKTIDEVVVVGYGTVKREAKTGSITSVSGDKIADVPASSVDKMLAGKLAGVQITSSSGQPGSNSNIRIRGTSSINASNEPLYVVDGIAIMVQNEGY